MGGLSLDGFTFDASAFRHQNGFSRAGRARTAGAICASFFAAHAHRCYEYRGHPQNIRHPLAIANWPLFFDARQKYGVNSMGSFGGTALRRSQGTAAQSGARGATSSWRKQ